MHFSKTKEDRLADFEKFAQLTDGYGMPAASSESVATQGTVDVAASLLNGSNRQDPRVLKVAQLLQTLVDGQGRKASNG